MTCSEIKYSEFLKYLLKEVTPPSYWPELQAEFSDLLRTPKSENVVDCFQKIVFTEWKINFLSASVGYLKQVYDAEIAEAIMLQGYDLIEDKEDRAEYLKQIYRIETESKNLVIILNQHVNEFNLLNPSGEIKRTRVDYEKELAILAKFQGYRLNDITASEFASIVNAWYDYKQMNEREKTE